MEPSSYIIEVVKSMAPHGAIAPGFCPTEVVFPTSCTSSTPNHSEAPEVLRCYGTRLRGIRRTCFDFLQNRALKLGGVGGFFYGYTG